MDLSLSFHRLFFCKLFLFLTLLFPAVVSRADSQQDYLDVLVDFERYAESVWHSASGTGRPSDSGYFGDGNSTGNGGIRGSCGIAFSYAVLVGVAQRSKKSHSPCSNPAGVKLRSQYSPERDEHLYRQQKVGT